MTREEAIKLLCVEKSVIVEVDGNKGAEKMLQAYDMAIEALQQEPVVRCKDCQYHEWCIPKQGRSEDDYCSRGKRREP